MELRLPRKSTGNSRAIVCVCRDRKSEARLAVGRPAYQACDTILSRLLPVHRRIPEFTTGAFATTLSEASKYRLSMTIAHRYIGQLSHAGNTELRHAVFGNVGSIVAFQD